MATVSVELPDDLVSRLAAAMRAGFPQYADLSQDGMFTAVTADYWRGVLTGYEARQAALTAQQTLAAAVAASHEAAAAIGAST